MNKLLGKLCGGLHKPNQQTVLPPCAVHALLDPLPVDRVWRRTEQRIPSSLSPPLPLLAFSPLVASRACRPTRFTPPLSPPLPLVLASDALTPTSWSSLASPLHPSAGLRGFGGKLGELLRAGRPEMGLGGFGTAGALRQVSPVASNTDGPLMAAFGALRSPSETLIADPRRPSEAL